MKPTPVIPPPPILAQGNWWKRGWIAVVRQRRLPTGLSVAWERLLIRLGFPYKTVSAAGLRFRVRRLAADEHFIRDVVVDEEYAPAGYEITEHDLVLDIGGNIGSFAIYAARKARHGRVVVLEPIKESFRLLLHNVVLNRCNNVVVKHAALVARRAAVRVYLSNHGSGGHSVMPALALQSQSFEEVEGVTLQDLLREFQLPHCDFLKLDCEGAEFQVLHEIDPDIGRRISKLVVEYHTFPERDKVEQAGQLVDRLVELGFTVDRYTDVIGTNWGTIYARRATSVTENG